MIACERCYKMNHPEILMLCDRCDDAYHTYCANPPLDKVPEEDTNWYCELCLKD